MSVYTEQFLFYLKEGLGFDNRPDIFQALDLFEKYGINNFESLVSEVVDGGTDVDPVSVDIQVLNKIIEVMVFIIESHGVIVDKDADISLDTLNKVAEFLLAIPNLEDYSYLTYRLNSSDSLRELFINILGHYTSLSRIKAMEALQDVTEGLIDSIRKIIPETESQELTICVDCLERSKLFFKFIEETPCEGLSLRDKGVVGKMTLKEIVDILPYILEDKLSNNMDVRPEQAALDVLSILMVSKDGCSSPLEAFKEHCELFTTKTMHISRIGNMLENMYMDFCNYERAVEVGRSV